MTGADFAKVRGRGQSCTAICVHADRVRLAKTAMVTDREGATVAELFKVFADPTRVRILSALAASELCVCDLGVSLEMSQSAMSHQLALLRAASLVKSRREGKVVYYSLDDDHVRQLLALGLSHGSEGLR